MMSEPTYDLLWIKAIIIACYNNKKAFSIFKSYLFTQNHYNMVDKILDLLDIAKLAFL